MNYVNNSKMANRKMFKLIVKRWTLSLAVMCFFWSLMTFAFIMPFWPAIWFWTGCMLWLWAVVFSAVWRIDELSNEEGNDPTRRT